MHVVEVKVQWDEDAHMLYIASAPNTMAKPITKNHVVKSNIT